MKHIPSILITIMALYIVYSFFKPDKITIEKKTEYIKGNTDSLRLAIIDSVNSVARKSEIEIKYYPNKINTRIKAEFDSLKAMVDRNLIVKSTFIDSGSNYSLKVNAFSPLPVDSFKIDLVVISDSILVKRVDTLKIETIKTIHTGYTWLEMAMAVIGGYALKWLTSL